MISAIPYGSIDDQPMVDVSYHNGITCVPLSLMVKICQLNRNKRYRRLAFRVSTFVKYCYFYGKAILKIKNRVTWKRPKRRCIMALIFKLHKFTYNKEVKNG